MEQAQLHEASVIAPADSMVEDVGLQRRAPSPLGPPGLPAPPQAPSREDLSKPSAPARHELVREVAEVVCKRADTIAHNMVAVFTEKGKETMKAWHREQAAQVEAIRSQLDTCTASYAQLRQENAALRTSLEAITRNIQMVTWTSPMPWVPPAMAGMPYGLPGGLRPPAASASSSGARGGGLLPHTSRQEGGRARASAKQAASTRALLQGTDRDRKATSAPVLPPTPEEGEKEGDDDEVEEAVMPGSEDEDTERQVTGSLASRFAFSPASDVISPVNEDEEEEGEEASLDEDEEAEETPVARRLVTAPEPLAHEGGDVLDAAAPQTPIRGEGASKTLPRLMAPPGLAPPEEAVTPEQPARSSSVSSLRGAAGKKAERRSTSGSRLAGLDTPSTAEGTPARASTDRSSPSTASPNPLRSPATSTFNLTLRRTADLPLGLKVRPHEHDGIRCLRVDKIQPDGMADAWNRSCPEESSRRLRQGDLLMSVNGVSVPEEMRAQCAQQLCLKLEILREAQQAP